MLVFVFLGITIYLLYYLIEAPAIDMRRALVALLGVAVVLIYLFVFYLPQSIPEGEYEEYTTITESNGNEYDAMVSFDVFYDDEIGICYGPTSIHWSNGSCLSGSPSDYVTYSKENFGNELYFYPNHSDESYTVVLPEIRTSMLEKLHAGWIEIILCGLCLLCYFYTLTKFITSNQLKKREEL